VPEKLKSVCGELDDGYNKKANLEEKMDYLKRNGKRFTVNQLHNLMTIINRDNLIDLYQRDPFQQIDSFKDVIENLDLKNSDLFDEPMRILMKKVINSYEPLKIVDVASSELDDLTNYLITANKNLYKNITGFLDIQSNIISNSEFNRLSEFLLHVHAWSRETKEQSIDNINLQTSFLFVQNAIISMGKIYPELLLNNADSHKALCKHWGFSDNHYKDIEIFLNKYYKQVEKFKGDEVIKQLLQTIQTKSIDIIIFMQNMPHFSDIKKIMKNEQDQEVEVLFHSLFNQTTYYEIIKYCFYRMINEFIICADDEDLLRTEVVQVRLETQERNNEIDDPVQNIETLRQSMNENYNTILNELEETDIKADSSDELKSRVASLIQGFLEIEIDNKSTINLSYEEIMKKVNRSKQREKQAIIEYLGNMSKEERKVEELFKMYKLGRWNVGQQKGLVSYDKNTYERERNELLIQLQNDESTKQYEMVSEMRREIFELEKDEEEQQNEFYDQEANDINDLDEDYRDGNFYAEDLDEL